MASTKSSFPKARRLRKRADFLRIQQAGRRVTCAHFVLLVAAQPAPASAPRLGLVVTKKIGNAVARNRIKRVCRECFRTTGELVPEGIDLIVIAREGAEKLALEDVRAEWKKARAQLQKRALETLAEAAKKAHVSPSKSSTSP